MRVLVVTVTHVPLDARIHARQIGALQAAGADVTYAAPWAVEAAEPPAGLRALDLPRAVGRRRLRALLAARTLLRREAGGHDLVLLHDPELLLVAGAGGSTPVVWDVHEDLGASLVARDWVPPIVRPALRRIVELVEWRAERRYHLILAEHGYAGRFRNSHPVVPNVPVVPHDVVAPGDERVVYVGRVAAARGADELLALARLLRGEVVVDVVGDAEDDVAPLLAAADERGDIRWHGRLPNEQALALVDGALAGVSLLRDLPNFRSSMPTKVLEYMARGVPVVTTPLPLAADVVTSADAGHVVGFGDVEGAAAAVRELKNDEARRLACGGRGHDYAATHHNWEVEGPAFVAQLCRWAGRAAVSP